MFESVEFFASNFCRHEGRNCITCVERANGTSVLLRPARWPNCASARLTPTTMVLSSQRSDGFQETSRKGFLWIQ